MSRARRFALAVLALTASLALPGAAGAQARAPGATYRDCPDCPEMVVVPAGSFVMGTPAPRGGPATVPASEMPPTVVRIARPFAIGRLELTRREYARFVADAQYAPAPGCRVWDATRERFATDATRTWQTPGLPAVPQDDHPVSCVSWSDAKAYVEWLAKRTGKPYRLPSSAEWEYAARAGSSGLRPWGDSADEGCEFANAYDLDAQDAIPLGWPAARCRDGHADLAVAGSLRPNAFGLLDTIGNVAEWVEDCATSTYVGRPRDGRAWTWAGGCARHVQRGGSWLSEPAAARPGAVASAETAERADSVGLRIAVDLDARAAEAR